MTKYTAILEHWSDEHMICNEFCRDYKRENPNAILKLGTHEGNDDSHCYVYDPDMDITFDATQRQFKLYNPCKYVDDFYMGDEHPHMYDVESFETIEAFNEGL